IPEPCPGKLVTAHRVAVTKRPILNAKKVRTHSVSLVVIECMLPLSPGEGKGEGPTITARYTLTLSPEGGRALRPSADTVAEEGKNSQQVLEELHLVIVPADDGRGIHAHPVLQDGGVHRAEIHVVFQIAALFLLTLLQGGVDTVDAALHMF